MPATTLISTPRSQATRSDPSVALISPAWPAGKISNGIVTYTSQLHQEFERRGTRCTVLSSHFSDPTSTDWVTACRPNWIRFSRWINAVARRSANLLPVVKPEIVSMRSAIAALQARGAVDVVEMEESFGNPALIARRLSVPLVVRLHGPWFLTNGPSSDNENTTRRIAAEKLGIETAAGVSAPSLAVLNAVRDYYQLELKNAAVIPNPIAPAVPNDRWDSATAAPQTVLFVGRFDSLKGGDTMLLAFDKVLQTLPETRLQFIGSDDGIAVGSGERMPISRFIAQKLSQRAQRQIDVIGRLPADQIDDYRIKARVVVVASRFENFPYSLLESMRLGCPTVASKVGGIPEILEHESTGLLFNVGDETDLAVKVVALLQAPQLGTKLGCAAAQQVEQRFHPKLVADQTLDFYKRVIGRLKQRHGI